MQVGSLKLIKALLCRVDTIQLAYTCVLHRMQALKEPIYTQREAEMAAGMGNYILKQPDTSLTDIDMSEQCHNIDSKQDSSGVRTDSV